MTKLSDNFGSMVFNDKVMKARLPKARENHDGYAGYGNLVDYRHINYDRSIAAQDYDAAFDELCRLQTALDTVNNSEKFRIDF